MPPKRAFATFGRRFGLELYRQGRHARHTCRRQTPAADARCRNPLRLSSRTIQRQFLGRRATMAAIKTHLLSKAVSFVASNPRRPPLAPTCARRPPRAKSTRASSPCPNPSDGAINPICALSLHSRVSFAVVTPAIRTTLRLRNRAPWALKSATNSPCHSAVGIIDSFIRRATKLPGGRRSMSMHLWLRASFGSKHIRRKHSRLIPRKSWSRTNGHKKQLLSRSSAPFARQEHYADAAHF